MPMIDEPSGSEDHAAPAFPLHRRTSRQATAAVPVGGRIDSRSELRSLVEKAADAIGANHGMGFVVDRARNLVTCRAVYRLSAQDVDRIAFKIGQGNTGMVAATGRPIRVNEGAITSERSVNLLAVPVSAGQETVAVLTFHGSSSRDGFTQNDERKVLELTSEAAPHLMRSLAVERDCGAGDGIQLSELVSAELLREIQDACSEVIGVPCVFEDVQGRCVLPISNAPDLCVLMRSRPTSAVECENSMCSAGAQARNFGGPFEIECHAGVKTLITPIFAREAHAGSLVAMLRYQSRNSAVVRTMAAGLGLDPLDALGKAALFPSAAQEQEPFIRLFCSSVARIIGALAEERLHLAADEQKLQERDSELTVIRELTRSLTGLVDLDPILTEIIRRTITLSGALAADISLISDQDRPQIRFHRGLQQGMAELLAPTLSDSPAARAIRAGEFFATSIADVAAVMPAWMSAVRRQPEFHSVVALPLGPAGKTIGAITAYFGETDTPRPEIIELLGAVANHATLAIQSSLATAQARSKEQAIRQFLARMTRGLSSSLDRTQLVQWIADFAAEITGAAHTAVYEEKGGELHIRATGRSGRAVVESQLLPRGKGLSGQVAASRRLLQVRDLRRDPRFVTTSATLPADAVTYVGAPLLYQDELLGVLAIYDRERLFSDEDLQLVASFALQAAVAIQNVHSYERQLEIATTMQQSFLPRERLRLPGLEAEPIYEPALEEVGGDYYDFIPLSPHRAAIVLGDVSGKGIRAATYTAMGKYVLRAYAFENSSPARVLKQMNDLMVTQVEPGIFITLFYGIIDLERMELQYASAGHPDALLFRPQRREFVNLSSTGLMVGAMPGETFDSRTVLLLPGDLLVLYTDGVIEARKGDELYGINRLQDVILANSTRPAAEVAAAIRDSVRDYHNTGLSDDLCILVLRLTSN